MANNKKLMMAMEQTGFTINRKDRPITSGGGTLKKSNAKDGKFYKAKVRGQAIFAIKSAIAARKRAYNNKGKK
jgi:hypothetical protein